MKYKLSLALLFFSVVFVSGCKKSCVVCTGMSAPREFCEGDFTQKSYYENAVNAYEATGGTCEEN
jgi:hypothetical protein